MLKSIPRGWDDFRIMHLTDTRMKRLETLQSHDGRSAHALRSIVCTRTLFTELLKPESPADAFGAASKEVVRAALKRVHSRPGVLHRMATFIKKHNRM
jgi:hypothetical protein